MRKQIVNKQLNAGEYNSNLNAGKYNTKANKHLHEETN
jgi:hypothetical protein